MAVLEALGIRGDDVPNDAAVAVGLVLCADDGEFDCTTLLAATVVCMPDSVLDTLHYKNRFAYHLM